MATETKKEGGVSKYIIVGSTWINELKSTMEITEVDPVNGNFKGLYKSKVGDAECYYELLGRFDTEGSSLGWVVSWKNEFKNAHSTTAWSGQMQLDPSTGKPVIFTTWLITSQTDPQDNWNSTNVGFDMFREQLPDESKTLKEGNCSHPKDAV